MEPVNPPGAPKPVGHYSPGLKHRGMMYVSGQLPLSTDQEPGQFGSVEQQTEQVVKNVQIILQGGGLDLSDIAKVTLYIVNVDDYAAVDRVYARMFGDHKPARSVIPVSHLHFGALVKMDVIAIE